MANEHRAWTRQGEAFWRAHHEAWKRSDLNQRQYCEAEGIPLKAFGNWRAQFKAEPQPPAGRIEHTARVRTAATVERRIRAAVGSSAVLGSIVIWNRVGQDVRPFGLLIIRLHA